MDPETEKIIKEQMGKLPEEVRRLFTDPELGDKIINIGKKNGLNIEQLGILQTETNLVMLGLVHPDEYSGELKNRLDIDPVKANNITNDVNSEILSGILVKLKEVYKKTDESLENIDEKETIEKSPALIREGLGEGYNGNHLETREEILARLEQPEIEAPARNASGIADAGGPHPILAQKLSRPMQIPSSKTEHSLENLTPAGAKLDVPKKYDLDPYREVPE